MVDLPEAERPVSQIVRPYWWRRAARSEWEREGCQVMFLWGGESVCWVEDKGDKGAVSGEVWDGG